MVNGPQPIGSEEPPPPSLPPPLLFPKSCVGHFLQSFPRNEAHRPLLRAEDGVQNQGQKFKAEVVMFSSVPSWGRLSFEWLGG